MEYATSRNMTSSNENGRQPTELQQSILDFIWANGPSTAEQVREGIGSTHPLKDSSIRTLLRRLEARGLLIHRLEGKVFVYSAAVPQRSLAARAVRHVIDRFCSGSV